MKKIKSTLLKLELTPVYQICSVKKSPDTQYPYTSTPETIVSITIGGNF
ncbi:hypothetical protein [Pedobacter sp. UYP1]|jgi:hypothetical protein